MNKLQLLILANAPESMCAKHVSIKDSRIFGPFNGDSFKAYKLSKQATEPVCVNRMFLLYNLSIYLVSVNKFSIMAFFKTPSS